MGGRKVNLIKKILNPIFFEPDLGIVLLVMIIVFMILGAIRAFG